MKLPVTGTSNLPGFRSVEEALRRGFEVDAAHYALTVPLDHEVLRKARLDLTDFQDVRELVLRKRLDAVVHVAAFRTLNSARGINNLPLE